MNQEKAKPELPPIPHKPEVKPPSTPPPHEAPRPEIRPDKDPSPSKGPAEVPPGKENRMFA